MQFIHSMDSAKIIWEDSFEGNLSSIITITTTNPKACNIQDNNGNTPLVFACVGDHLEVITALIEKGGNIHIKNRAGVNALYFAKGSQRRSQILKLWEKHTPEAKALATGNTVV